MSELFNKLHISKEKGVDINKGMIGLFFEDINYGADGGLYAEMLENRNFEFVMARGDKDDYTTTYDGGYGWSAYPVDESGAMLELLTEEPLSQVNPHYLKFTGKDNQLGFTNKAYDGIYFEKGKSYQLTFYAKANDYKGSILVEVRKENEVFGTVQINESITGQWKKYTAIITATNTIRFGEFVISLSEPGTVCFDFISLMPGDAICNLFRSDLVKLIQDIKPGFVRFPGGCIVEGNTLENRYKWKESVGSEEDRKANWNRWAVHGNRKENDFLSEYAHYNQTLGMGYYEYFILCEYLKAKAIPVLSVGLACQYQSTEKVSIDSNEFNEYIQDALDLIEFANGDESTTWGSVRVKMGHKEPFNLEYIGVGNEQWETAEADYFKRYECFEKALHEKYPEIKIISSAGPNVKSDTYNAAWEWILEKQKENPKFTAAIDEHYYVRPNWCYENINFYDNYARDVKVFAGEYAAHIEHNFTRPLTEVNNMEAALAEAAFMTGLERNADVVHLAAYAPLFARVGYTQWAPDLIWFDDCSSYGTPSYYVQMMYGNNMGDYTLKSNLDGTGVYSTVSYDEINNEIIVKLVNSNESNSSVNIVIDDNYKVEQVGKVIKLASDNLANFNNIEKPNLITSKEQVIENIANDFDFDLSGYSFYVLRIKVLN